MTSAQIRQSFLDFFHARRHTIVPSSPLMPDSPGLLFTNAGMNQFVPIFLNERKPDVSGWAGVRAAADTRAADTQKCIRAGGKHNDLEDVGFDTYHHTLFEMLGNWSFGDYFKKESLEWGWELLTKVWGIPAKRLFATVYSPDKSKGDPSDFDQEAYDIWAEIFKREGLDPEIHIVRGNRKDNFWMMGDTGPCGPCSEIHFNLLPSDDELSGRALVNASSPRCIEIWNHVFIQFDARPDGSFIPLPSRHVDTGMGFERVAGIYASTQGFTDFSRPVSNYEADVFTAIFTTIAGLSGKKYTGTVPERRDNLSGQERIDIAFRVLADHARCVSCAIADGILPGNNGRNYVVRRILRRGILYGRKDLGLGVGFFAKLVAPVVDTLGTVFPELKSQQGMIERVIRSEEETFGRTLDRGIQLFNEAALSGDISGSAAFTLYDTYGFPLDMTQLLAAERGLKVDEAGFEAAMEKQRERGRAAQEKDVISVSATDAGDAPPTPFIGYHIGKSESFRLRITDLVPAGENGLALVFEQTPFYAEMGGQMGDRGVLLAKGRAVQIGNTTRAGGRVLHRVSNLEGHVLAECPPNAETVDREFLKSIVGMEVEGGVNLKIRRATQRHHSATHLLHFALRRVLGKHVRQAGSLVNHQRLRFDFSHFEAVGSDQLRQIEAIVNERILDNASIRDYEIDYASKPADVIAFFGDKYGTRVRVVDIGGYSRELCGGTHAETTGELGFFKIVSESAIAAGTRRIEAVAGQAAVDFAWQNIDAVETAAARLQTTPSALEKRLEEILAHRAELERRIKAFEQRETAALAAKLAASAGTAGGFPRVVAKVEVSSPDALRELGAAVLGQLKSGVVILGAAIGDKASVAAFASADAVKAGHAAGKIVSELCTKLGGKGGGKPEFAMGGGKEVSKLAEILSV
jgi:alanyl-tRNA synthetase